MIIVNEKNAPAKEMPEPFRRTLKLLFSPVFTPELKSIAVGLTILPPAGKSDDIGHEEGEMFYAVFGKGEIKVDGETEEFSAGTAVWVPSGRKHQLINNSNDTLKVLWVLSPPGREVGMMK